MDVFDLESHVPFFDHLVPLFDLEGGIRRIDCSVNSFLRLAVIFQPEQDARISALRIERTDRAAVRVPADDVRDFQVDNRVFEYCRKVSVADRHDVPDVSPDEEQDRKKYR
ncbi:MAG TPA: hypothetical protein VLY83_06675 [Methanoregula sp.]|nr:hypothetical protein [Methanoregula sp.]